MMRSSSVYSWLLCSAIIISHLSLGWSDKSPPVEHYSSSEKCALLAFILREYLNDQPEVHDPRSLFDQYLSSMYQHLSTLDFAKAVFHTTTDHSIRWTAQLASALLSCVCAPPRMILFRWFLCRFSYPCGFELQRILAHNYVALWVFHCARYMSVSSTRTYMHETHKHWGTSFYLDSAHYLSNWLIAAVHYFDTLTCTDTCNDGEGTADSFAVVTTQAFIRSFSTDSQAIDHFSHSCIVTQPGFLWLYGNFKSLVYRAHRYVLHMYLTEPYIRTHVTPGIHGRLIYGEWSRF